MNVHHMDTEKYLTAISQVIGRGNQVAIPVRGSSMQPFLADSRDAVLIGPVDRRLRRGDIVLYQREGGQFVLHRIIRVDRAGSSGERYYIRGDAQSAAEGPVEPRQICALVIRVRRKGKWLAAYAPINMTFRYLWHRRSFPRRAVCVLYRQICLALRRAWR